MAARSGGGWPWVDATGDGGGSVGWWICRRHAGEGGRHVNAGEISLRPRVGRSSVIKGLPSAPDLSLRQTFLIYFFQFAECPLSSTGQLNFEICFMYISCTLTSVWFNSYMYIWQLHCYFMYIWNTQARFTEFVRLNFENILPNIFDNVYLMFLGVLFHYFM